MSCKSCLSFDGFGFPVLRSVFYICIGSLGFGAGFGFTFCLFFCFGVCNRFLTHPASTFFAKQLVCVSGLGFWLTGLKFT